LTQKKSNQNNSFEIPAIALWAGKTLQFFSKESATRYVARLFATPLKIQAPERELVMRQSSKKERLFVKKIDKEVQVYLYGYSKKRILLVHGWAGRGTQLYHLADKLLEERMMVVSFDGPAHGLSDGKRTNMLEFLETIREVEKKYGPFDAAIGHSFGGMSLIHSISNGLKTNKLVTIGADNSIRENFDYFVQKMELRPSISLRMQTYFEKLHHVKIDSMDSDKKAERIKIPVLVVHDSDDKFVNVSSAISIRQKLRNGKLLITNGLGHHRIFKNPYVIRRIISYLQ